MDKHDKNFFVGAALIVTSTVISMYTFRALGSSIFFLPAIVPTIILGVFMGLISLIAMWVFSMATFITFNKVDQPGILIPLLLGIISGTVGIWLAANLLPEAITLASLWDGLLFSLLNTPLTAALLLLAFPKMRTKKLWPTIQITK